VAGERLFLIFFAEFDNQSKRLKEIETYNLIDLYKKAKI